MRIELRGLIGSLLLCVCLAPNGVAATAREKPAKIKVNPRSGIAGSTFVATGSVARGARSARILWDDGTTASAIAEAVVDAAGKFVVTCAVPANAPTGLVQVCAVTSGAGRLGTDLGRTPFRVLPTPPGRANGQVTTTNELGGLVPLGGATIVLTTAEGGPVYTNDNSGTKYLVGPFVTDTNGNFNVPGLPPGNYLLEVNQDGYFADPTPVAVPSGGSGNALVPVFPNFSDSKIISVGALALNLGALSGMPKPEIVSTAPAGGVGTICSFGSLPGLGAMAEVRVRFWAKASFPTNAPLNQRAVRFQIFDGSANVLWDWTQTFQGPVHPDYAWINAYASTALLTDMNVSEFPADLLTLRVTPLVNGAPGVFKDYSIQMVDLKSRWFPCWLSDQQVAISKGAGSGLLYDFTGYAPSATPNLLVNLPIDLVIETFQNQISANAEIHESWQAGQGFLPAFHPTRLTANVKLMSSDIVNGTWPYAAKFQPGGEVDSYQLKPFTAAGPKEFAKFKIYQNGPGIGCVDVCYFDCEVCAGWKVWVDFTLEGSLEVSSSLNSDLKLDVDITPFVSGTIGGHVRAKLVVCGLDADVTGTADIGLPFHYQNAPCPGSAGFANPCVRLSADANADFSCLDLGFGGGGSIGPYTFGDCPGFAAPLKTQVAFASDQVQVDESPAVAADGAGGALALWVEQDPADAETVYRLLRFSRFQNGTWSEDQPVWPVPALLNHPQLAFRAPNDAFALWAQNHRTPAQILEDGGAQLANQDIYWARWDGAAWSEPAAITADSFAEGFPHVAADPASGRVLAVWTRANTDDPDADPTNKFFTIVYSVYDGAGWSEPTQIAPSAPSVDYQTSLAFDHDGNAWLAWTRDQDGDLTTFADRVLLLSMWDGANWTTPETIPGTPEGAFSPSLALDALNQPLVIFTVPPSDNEGRLTSGVSNRNQLWAAYRRGRGWEIMPVGDPFYAEEPVVAINADNQAIIMFRRFADDVSVHRDGDLAAAVADLNQEPLAWKSDWLTEDGQTNWKTAFAVDPNSAMNFVLNVKLPAVQLPGAAAAVPVLAQMTFPNTPDLAISESDFTLSEAFPAVGDTITLFATVHNRGLGPVPAGSSFTVTFYDGDPAKGTNKLGKVIGTATLNGPLRFGETAQASIPFLFARGGRHIITAVVQPGRGLADQQAANNTARMTLGVPFAPANLVAASDSAGQRIVLRWEAPLHRQPLRYRVYRSTTSGSGYELIGISSGTTFSDTRAAADTTHYYVVAAVDPYGVVSGFSNEAAGEWNTGR